MSIKKILVTLTILLAVFIFLKYQEGNEIEASIAPKFAKVEHPIDSQAIRNRSMRKIVFRTIEYQYSGYHNIEEIHQHYDKQMLDLGWHKVPREYPDSEFIVSYYYKKNNFLASLVISKDVEYDGTRRWRFGIERTDIPSDL